MIKISLKIVLLFCSFSCNQINNKLLWYSSLKLSWRHFKGNPEANNYTAYIACSIEYKKLADNKFAIYAYMNKNLSWHKWKAYQCLPHEQYHFNIAELYARKLRKYIIENKFVFESTEFMRAYNEHLYELKTAQQKYDNETNHSLENDKQIEWQHFIDQQLHSYERFTDYTIEL